MLPWFVQWNLVFFFQGVFILLLLWFIMCKLKKGKKNHALSQWHVLEFVFIYLDAVQKVECLLINVSLNPTNNYFLFKISGIYSPNAYRGFAREFIKDLERLRLWTCYMFYLLLAFFVYKNNLSIISCVSHILFNDSLLLFFSLDSDLGPYLTSLNQVKISGFPLLPKCLSKGPVNVVVTFQVRYICINFRLKDNESPALYKYKLMS